MNNVELIQSLIDDVDRLPHQYDEEKLDALKRRAEMIISKVKVDSGKYLHDLQSIIFFPLFPYATEEESKKAWASGKNMMTNLLNTIAEEFKLSYMPQIEDKVIPLYGALRSELSNQSVQEIRNIAAAAGIDVTKISAKSESRTGIGSRAEVMPSIDRLFGELPTRAKNTALCIIAERLTSASPEVASSVQKILGQHGFQFIERAFVPIGLLDSREARYLPPSSASEIARATARLVDGDESGAITAACGAVDTITQKIYEKYNLGDPGKTAFSAKVNTVLKHLSIFEDMEKEYHELGMSEEDASSIVVDFKKTINHSAQVLQTLRRTMGDVHGLKPTLRKAAYDSIKFASAICGLLEGKI